MKDIKPLSNGNWAEVVALAGTTDSMGQAFDLDSCNRAYAYTNGLLTTDTATLGATNWVKTYTYTNGMLSGETKWVRQ